MKLFSLIFYLLSLGLLYLSLMIIDPKLDYSIFFNKYGIFSIITGFALTLISFSPKEIIQTLKTIIMTNKYDYNLVKSSELIIGSLWKNILYTGILYFIVINIVFLINSDKYILSDYIFNSLSVFLYVFFMKTFVFKPLELSVLKKIILLKL